MEFERRDGTIVYKVLTNERLDKALELFSGPFIEHESICRLVNVSGNRRAIDELANLCRAICNDDRLSIVAIDESTAPEPTVVGVSFNKLQRKPDRLRADAPDYYTRYKTEHCHELESQQILEFMIEGDNLCDVFERYAITTAMELVFVVTKRSYWGRGIARNLCATSIELAGRQTTRIDAVTAIFTSFKTQAIGHRLKFERLCATAFDRFSFWDKRLQRPQSCHEHVCTDEFKNTDDDINRTTVVTYEAFLLR